MEGIQQARLVNRGRVKGVGQLEQMKCICVLGEHGEHCKRNIMKSLGNKDRNGLGRSRSKNRNKIWELGKVVKYHKSHKGKVQETDNVATEVT